jgi:hypothetical protein
LEREDIFKPAIGNESLNQGSNDNGGRIVKFATSENVVVKSTVFLHRNVHKYTWTYPDGKTHKQFGHVIIDRRWHSSILDVHLSGEVNVILVVVKVRERLAVRKQAVHKFDVQGFNHRNLSELEVTRQCQIKISNRFSPLENLNDSDGINRDWENIKEYIETSVKESLGLYELKQYKPRFEEEYLRFFIPKEAD